MNINSTNVLILLASPTEQDGAMPLQKYMYSYVQGGSIQQPGSDTQSAQQLPLDSSLPSCCHLDMQVPRASATLQWLVQTLSLTHAPTRTSCCHSQPACAPALREKYFHTQNWPLETHSPPGSQATLPTCWIVQLDLC